MRKALWIFAAIASLLVVALGAAWRGGIIRAPWSRQYDRIVEQLRDRGTVAVLGDVPLGMPAVEFYDLGIATNKWVCVAALLGFTAVYSAGAWAVLRFKRLTKR